MVLAEPVLTSSGTRSFGFSFLGNGHFQFLRCWRGQKYQFQTCGHASRCKWKLRETSLDLRSIPLWSLPASECTTWQWKSHRHCSEQSWYEAMASGKWAQRRTHPELGFSMTSSARVFHVPPKHITRRTKEDTILWDQQRSGHQYSVGDTIVAKVKVVTKEDGETQKLTASAWIVRHKVKATAGLWEPIATKTGPSTCWGKRDPYKFPSLHPHSSSRSSKSTAYSCIKNADNEPHAPTCT